MTAPHLVVTYLYLTAQNFQFRLTQLHHTDITKKN
jgi:hypothetical protein